MKRFIQATMLAAILTFGFIGFATAQPDAPPPDDAGSDWSGHGGGYGGGSGGPGGGHARGGSMMMGGPGGMHFLLAPEGRLLHGGGRLADQLKLTSTQRDQLSDIGDNLMREQIESRANLQLARLDLKKLLRSDSPSRSAIDAKISSITGIQAGMMKAAVSAKFAVRT